MVMTRAGSARWLDAVSFGLAMPRARGSAGRRAEPRAATGGRNRGRHSCCHLEV